MKTSRAQSIREQANSNRSRTRLVQYSSLERSSLQTPRKTHRSSLTSDKNYALPPLSMDCAEDVHREANPRFQADKIDASDMGENKVASASFQQTVNIFLL